MIAQKRHKVGSQCVPVNPITPAHTKPGHVSSGTPISLYRHMVQSQHDGQCNAEPLLKLNAFGASAPWLEPHEKDGTMMDGMVEILLVEDNPDDIEMTVSALRKSNVTNPIMVARDGEQALAAIFGDPGGAVRRPLMILLDLNLPKIDGLEVLRRVRADARTRTIPVVVLTVSHDDHVLTEARRLNVACYIVKPVDFSQFVAVARSFGLRWAVYSEPPSRTTHPAAGGDAFHVVQINPRIEAAPLSAGQQT